MQAEYAFLQAEDATMRAAIENAVPKANDAKYNNILNIIANNASKAKRQMNYNGTPQQYLESLSSSDSPITILSSIIEEMFDWSESDFSVLNNILKDTYNYGSLDELQEALGDIILPEQLQKELNKYYIEQTKQYQKNAEDMITAASKENPDFKEYYEALGFNEEEFNSPLEQKILSQLLKIKESVYQAISEDDLFELGDAGKDIIKYIDKLPQTLKNSMKESGFSSVGQIDSYIESITKGIKTGEISKEVGDPLIAALEIFKKHTVNNISLSIQSALEGLDKSLDTAISNMGKLESGQGFEDTVKTITSLNQYLDEAHKLDLGKDFTFDGKKFEIKADSWDTAYTAIKTSLEADRAGIQKTIDGYVDLSKTLGDKSFTQFSDEERKAYLEMAQDILGTTEFEKYVKNGKFISGQEGAFADALEQKGGELATKLASYTSRLNYLNVYNEQIKLSFDRYDSAFKAVFDQPADISVANAQELATKLGYDDYTKMVQDGLLTVSNGIISMTALQMQAALAKAGEENLSTEARNNLQASIDTQIKKERGITAASNIMTNWAGNITDDMLLAWANATGQELENVKKQFIEVGNGKWAGSGDLKQWIESNGQQYNLDAKSTYGKYLETRRSTLKSSWESIIKSLGSDVQRIEQNATTNAIFTDQMRQQLGEMGINISEQWGYWVIDGLNANTEQLLAYLENDSSGLDSSTRASLIESATKSSMTSIISSIVKGAGSISASQGEQLASVLKIGDIADLKNLGVLSWDKSSQTYFANLHTLYEILEQTKEGLEDQTEINELQKLIRETQLNDLSTEIKNTTSNIKDGFSSFAEANEVLKTMNQKVVKQDQTELQFTDLFEWDKELNKYVYSLNGITTRFEYLKVQLKQAKYEGNQEEIDRITNEMAAALREIGSSIDLMKAFSISGTKQEQAKARQEIANAIDKYNAAAGSSRITQTLLDSALDGNISALEFIYNKLGKTLTTEDIQTVKTAKAAKVKTAIEALNTGVGAIIDQTTSNILAGAVEVEKIGNTGMSIIKNITNLEQAQLQLYQALSQSGQATITELNEAALKVLQAHYQTEDTGLQLLQNGANIGIDQLTSFMSNLGVNIGNSIDEFLQKVNPYIERIGGSNVRITNIVGLLSEYGLSPEDSELGKQYYSAYLDSIISAGNQAKQDALKVISSLQSASGGQQINAFGITGLSITAELESQLNEFGATFSEGIITLAKSELIITASINFWIN